jgi:hypothetical protein
MQVYSKEAFAAAEKNRENHRSTVVPSPLRDTAIFNELLRVLGHDKIVALANVNRSKEMHPKYFLQGSVTDPRRLHKDLLTKTNGQPLAVLIFSYVRMIAAYGVNIIEPFCNSISIWFKCNLIDENTMIIIYSSDNNDASMNHLRKLQFEEEVIPAQFIPLYTCLTNQIEKKYLNAESNEKELGSHNKELTFNVFRLSPQSIELINKQTESKKTVQNTPSSSSSSSSFTTPTINLQVNSNTDPDTNSSSSSTLDNKSLPTKRPRSTVLLQEL